jgi:hypothetical protein
MRRPDEGPTGPQDNRENMERMAGPTGSGSATGATSSGMQDTGSTTYQQSGYQQQDSRTQTATSYGQGRAPERSADYGTSGYGYGQRTPSRHGAAISILAGALAFLEGLAYIIRSHYYHTVAGYAYRWTLHGWGWVLLILGALLIAGGVSHMLDIKGSRQFTATVAVITAVVAFLTIFYSVVWGIVVVAACAWAAHSLLSDSGRDERYGADRDAMGYGGQTYEGMSQSERQGAMSQGGGSHRR